MTKVDVTCLCGVKFMAKQSDIKRGWGKSCSKSCAATKTNRKTGNFKNFLRSKDVAIGFEDSSGFSNANLFSNEDN